VGSFAGVPKFAKPVKPEREDANGALNFSGFSASKAIVVDGYFEEYQHLGRGTCFRGALSESSSWGNMIWGLELFTRFLL
jgi:hypothetical protein